MNVEKDSELSILLENEVDGSTTELWSLIGRQGTAWTKGTVPLKTHFKNFRVRVYEISEVKSGAKWLLN